ncbi:unnamed protein product [Mytilus edulis]|uniref:Uncharacterized protein n=1 Tax=Mytilus edulis TaxID=6550 RepID=A0A8S3RJX6_MYTED|nr:unnamed protein product [Mytilus edulis]
MQPQNAVIMDQPLVEELHIQPENQPSPPAPVQNQPPPLPPVQNQQNQFTEPTTFGSSATATSSGCSYRAGEPNDSLPQDIRVYINQFLSNIKMSHKIALQNEAAQKKETKTKKYLAQPFNAYIYVTHQGFATMLSQPANVSKQTVQALAADSDSLYP